MAEPLGDYSSDSSSEDEIVVFRGIKRAQPLKPPTTAQVAFACAGKTAENDLLDLPEESSSDDQAPKEHSSDVVESRVCIATTQDVVNQPQKATTAATKTERLSEWDKRIVNGHLRLAPKTIAVKTPPKPTPRPISEPPMFNYDKFEREFVPSDKRAKLLYPDCVEKRTTHRDLVTECELLRTYSTWTKLTTYERRKCDGEFLSALADDIAIELSEVENELRNFDSSTAGTLARWEYDHLDNDGGTTFLEQEFKLKRDIFDDCEEAREKYGSLCSRTLEQWERLFDLDDARRNPSILVGCDDARRKYGHRLLLTLEEWEGKNLSEGGKGLREFLVAHISSGSKVNFSTSEEAEIKYGYITSPSLTQWEDIFMDVNGDFSYIREKLLKGFDVFGTCNEARTKYQHLIPTELEKWEHNVIPTGDTSEIRSKLLYGINDLFKNCVEAKTKYQHLVPTELEKWEHQWLRDGKLKSWIETFIYQEIETFGTDVFAGYEDARIEYGYLLSPILEQWEKAYLDDDGGTTWIKRQLLEKRDVFWRSSAARSKYKHLIPTELELWEHRYLDYNGGTTSIKEKLLAGDNVLSSCKEAGRKYANLLPTDLELWEFRHFRNYGKEAALTEASKGLDPAELFKGCPEAREKYEHLVLTPLERWEHLNLDRHDDVVEFKCKGQSVESFFKDCPEAKAKYGYLFRGQLCVVYKFYLKVTQKLSPPTEAQVEQRAQSPSQEESSGPRVGTITTDDQDTSDHDDQSPGKRKDVHPRTQNMP